LTRQFTASAATGTKLGWLWFLLCYVVWLIVFIVYGVTYALLFVDLRLLLIARPATGFWHRPSRQQRQTWRNLLGGLQNWAVARLRSTNKKQQPVTLPASASANIEDNEPLSETVKKTSKGS
jgi:hypothetical protein